MSKKLTQIFSRVAEVELVYRNKARVSERSLVKESKAAYELLLKTWDMDKIELQEQFRVLLLDRKNGCMGISTIATGGISACVADPKIAFALALKASAASIIIAHNHPSGNKTPSAADESLTRRFAAAGQILDLPVLDHLIITREGYTSLADEGYMSRVRVPETASMNELFIPKKEPI
jgi:DNA repair protein RadC